MAAKVKIDLNTFADDLKRSVDIVEHIRKYENLRQVGESWQGPHSAHSSESSESTCFSINKEEGYYNCFHCGEGGDVIAFEASRLEITQVEAMKMRENILLARKRKKLSEKASK